jgi:peptide/nickel transport system ATP-binding protein
VEESHKTIDPKLEPVPGNPAHQVACLLEPEVRRKLWRELREGVKPEVARQDVMEEKAV